MSAKVGSYCVEPAANPKTGMAAELDRWVAEGQQIFWKHGLEVLEARIARPGIGNVTQGYWTATGKNEGVEGL